MPPAPSSNPTLLGSAAGNGTDKGLGNALTGTPEPTFSPNSPRTSP
jgi:hypothetical protein